MPNVFDEAEERIKQKNQTRNPFDIAEERISSKTPKGEGGFTIPKLSPLQQAEYSQTKGAGVGAVVSSKPYTGHYTGPFSPNIELAREEAGQLLSVDEIKKGIDLAKEAAGKAEDFVFGKFKSIPEPDYQTYGSTDRAEIERTKKRLAASSRWQELEAKAADILSNPVTEAFAHPIKNTILASQTAGKLLAGKMADVLTAVNSSPQGREAEALMEGLFGPNDASRQNAQDALKNFEPLPIMEELARTKGKSAALASASLGSIESIPLLAIGAVIQSVGGPQAGALAFSTLFGFESYMETGDPVRAMQAAGMGLVLPQFAQTGTHLGAEAAVRIGIQSTAGQKALEMLGHQMALQATAHVASAPDYAQMSPEEAKRAALETTFSMLYFAAFDAGKIDPRIRSYAQTHPELLMRLSEKTINNFFGDNIEMFKRDVDKLIGEYLLNPQYGQMYVPGGAREPYLPPEGVILDRSAQFPSREEAIANRARFERKKIQERARLKRERLKERIKSGKASPWEIAEWRKAVGAEKGQKPTVPEGPEPTLAETLSLGRDIPVTEAPVEAPGAQTFTDFIDLFKKRGGRADMTIREVQELMPEAFPGKGNREGARMLRDAAFPKVTAEEKPARITDEEAQAVADELGIRYDGIQDLTEGRFPDMERATFTITEEGPAKGQTFVLSPEATPDMIRARYREKIDEAVKGAKEHEAALKAEEEAKSKAEAEAKAAKEAKAATEVPPAAPPVAPTVAPPEAPVAPPAAPAPVEPPAPAPAPPAPVPTPAAPTEVPTQKTQQTPVPAQQTPGLAQQPQVPKPAIKPSGLFSDSTAKKALEELKRKKPPQPPPISEEEASLEGVAETVEGVRRPASEWEDIAFEGAEFSAPSGATGETSIRYPGESKPSETPLYEQETLNQLINVGGNALESGLIDYPTWYRAMTDLVGAEYRHYFRRAYNQMRDVPALHEWTKVMTPREEVELYNDAGEKIGLGSKHRPGLIVRNEDLMPPGDPWYVQFIVPNRWIGPEGDTIDWTQSRAAVMTMSARAKGAPAVMIADGPGVGKSGIGAIVAHMLTFPLRESVNESMGRIWDRSTARAKARWLNPSAAEGEMPDYGEVWGAKDLSISEESKLETMTWDSLREEQKQKVARNYGFNERQISEDNVNAGNTERNKVLIVGTNTQQIETSFKPDFEKFGIPMDHIEFITYDILSNPGPEGSKSRKLFDRITNTDWAAVIFDEAHALKNAGSSREHNQRKLKAPFKVFMTATPMDNVPNAAYFMAEITGKTKEQIYDQLGLRKIIKVVGGEDREFVVQKPGISALDVTKAIIRMREKAIADGLMIRREFPWWGEVVGRESETPILQHFQERWTQSSDSQKADWIYKRQWDRMSPPQRAKLLLPSLEPPARNWAEASQFSRQNFTPFELDKMANTKWEDLRPEQKAKIFRAELHLEPKDWRIDKTKQSGQEIFDEDQFEILRNAGYKLREIDNQTAITKGEPGPYWLDAMTPEEKAIEQKVWDKWEDLKAKAKSKITKRNYAGIQLGEVKRIAETFKAKRTVDIIERELKAGRNVVIYSNTVNNYRVRGLGESALYKVEKVPNDDWPIYEGSLGLIAKELEARGIVKPENGLSQIYGSTKAIKTRGIKLFYSNQNRVALVTPESGGAGLNLDDVVGRHPRTLIVVDMTFKGDTFEQLMYRVSRRNTASESKAYILMFPNSIADAHIRKKMNHKLAILRGIQAGKDTDFTTFLEDLNNPADMRIGEKWTPDVNAPMTDFPKMEWVEIISKSGRRRWRAEITKEFDEWWNKNGQQQNPLKLYRTVGGRYYGKPYVWSNTRPEFEALKDEGKPIDHEEASSKMGGYKNPAEYSGHDYQDLVESISAFESLISDGVDVPENTARVAKMKEQLYRMKDVDNRTQQILDADPEFREIQEKLDMNPDEDGLLFLESLRKEKIAEVSASVEETAPAIPEDQLEMTSPPGTVPNAVVPPQLKKPRAMYDIARDLKIGIGIPIQFGMTGRWGGFYMPTGQYIRIKRASDYPGTFHEAGHKLDNAFKLRSNPLFVRELENLGDPTVPGSRSSWTPGKTHTYLIGEGVAEFVRRWTFEPASAKAMAPKFWDYWENLIDANETELGFMRMLKRDVKDYMESPMWEKAKSHLTWGEADRRSKVTLASLWNTFIEQTFDQYHYIKLMSDDAFQYYKGSAKGGSLLPSRDPYILYRLLAGTFGRAEAWVKHGIVNPMTYEVNQGTSLMHALEGVKNRIEDFDTWLVMVQALEMLKKGQDPGIDPAIVRAGADKFSKDQAFQNAFRKLMDWQDMLLRSTMQTGLISGEDYIRMKKENAVVYVPMRRLFEIGYQEKPVTGGGMGRQAARVGKPSSLKTRTGSDRPIFSPVGSMIENAYWMTYASEKNRAINSLARLANLPGMGYWIRPVPAPVEKVQFQIGRIRTALRDMGVDLGNISDATLIEFYRQSKSEKIGTNTIRVKDGDTIKFYELRPELFKSVMAADRVSMNGVMKVLAAPSQLLRAGVTLDPSFAFWRNVLRDTVSAAVISRYSIFPFEASIRGAYALLAPGLFERIGFKGKAEELRKIIGEWKAGGGEHAVEATYFDRAQLQKFYEEQFAKKHNYATRGLFLMKNPLQALRMLSQVGEQATRIGEYQKVYNTIMASKEMAPLDAHFQAAFEARDLQDFSMQGSNPVVQGVKMLTAFFNAAIQGQHRFWNKSFYEKRRPDAWKGTLLKGGLYVMLPKLIEQYVNWDNEDYWNAPQWRRALFFHIPIGKYENGQTRFMLIPIPFEVGIVFASIPGAILEYAKKQNLSAAETFATDVFMPSLVPNPVPQWLTLFLESQPNLGYDFFQKRQLMPRGMEKEPYWTRWNDTTSLTARNLSKAMRGSPFEFAPAKIEHIIRRSTGGIGTMATHYGIDPIIGAITGEEGAAVKPSPIRGIITGTAPMQSQIIEDFYEKLNAMQMEHTARTKHKYTDKRIDLRDLRPMITAERQMADVRRNLRGEHDEKKRAKIIKDMENIARRWVRNPDNTYKEYRK